MIDFLNGYLREGVGNDSAGLNLIQYGWRHDFRLRQEADDSSDDDASSHS